MNIPKGSYDDESLKPAWIPIQNGDGTPAKPMIRCACGALMSIRLHHVHGDGRVTASFLHPIVPQNPPQAPEHQGCGFHEFLVLDGYDGPEFPGA